MKPIEAVIFDMDGTLIDSEPNYRVADERFLRDRGVELPEEVWDSFVGVGSRNMIERVKAEHGLRGETDELLEIKDAYYREIAETRTRVFPATAELTRRLEERGIPRAVATGSSRSTLSFSLEAVGLADRFNATVSSDEVESGKPAPDVFLETASRLGVAPDRCLVVEDSRSGIEAALAAGMAVVAVPSVSELRNDPILRRVRLTISEGAEALEPEAVLQLIEESGGSSRDGSTA